MTDANLCECGAVRAECARVYKVAGIRCPGGKGALVSPAETVLPSAHADQLRRWARAEAGKRGVRRVVRRDLLRFARECGRSIVRRPNFAERMAAIRGAKGWHEVTHETQAGCLPIRLSTPVRCF